jgi:hypothetical protein
MDFNFETSPSQNEGNNNDPFGTSEPNSSNNNGFLNMDFQSPPEQSQQKTTLDDMLNMNFEPLSEQSQPKNDMVLNMGLDKKNNFDLPPKIDDEEQKRIADRKKEAEERKEKINQKIKKENELRQEIIKKAREYMVEFEEKRQERIAMKRKELEEKNSQTNQNKGGESNADSWGRINSNIDLKDSEYKGSKDVQRMREAMMNRTNDPNSEPIKNFFG